MKKILVLTLAISLVVAGIALAGVLSSKHDMRGGYTGASVKAAGAATTQVCVFCHHPHRGNSTVTTTLLWNINDRSATYPTYGPTASTNSANMGGDISGNESAAAYSLLCMGCHDGASASNTWIKTAVDGTLGSFINLNATAANLNENLQDDHPVDFTYPTSSVPVGDDIKLSSDGGATVVGQTSSTVYPLYNKTMQCATCHNVHNGQSIGVQFMRGTTNVIAQSIICRDCHTSK